MCLALPARVVALLPDDQASVDLGGVRKTVSLALVPEAQVGDYVIVHVGHAIGLLDADEAGRTLALFAEMSVQAPASPEPVVAVQPTLYTTTQATAHPTPNQTAPSADLATPHGEAA